MKKICHLTSVHSCNDVRIYHKECCSLVKAGFEVHMIATNTPNETINGVQFHCVPNSIGGRLSRMTKTVYAVYKVALSIKADLYHFHDPELLLVGFLLKLRGRKVIYDSHEDLPRQMLSKPWLYPVIRKPLSWFFEFFENTIARKLDAVVTATPFIGKRFKQAGCLAQAVNNFPKMDEFDIVATNWDVKERVVCYAGGISEIRCIKEMVSAIRITNGRLLLAGAFSPQKLRNEIISMNGWNSVDEFGLLDRKEMVKLLSRSYAGLVLFHPLPNHIDAQPNKIFEYMAAGIPLVASNFPLWKEIIEVNDCGLCVDPLNPDAIAQAISWLLDHPVDAKRMGENGRRAVEEKYTWERESEKLIDLYRSLLLNNQTI